MGELDRIKAATARVRKVVETLKSLKGWGGVFRVFRIAKDVVAELQAAGAELGLEGREKKEIAVNLIVELCPDSWISDDNLRPIAGWAVENAVAYYKKKGWPGAASLEL